MTRALVLGSFGLLGLYAAAGALFVVDNLDIWFHLRLGAELAGGADVPTADAWSATAAGRPWVAHEWLAARVFHALFTAGGGAALTALRVCAVVLVVVLLFFAHDRERRAQPLAAAFTAVAVVLVVGRATVRPHLFSLVLVAALVLCLEVWRRERRWRALLALVPLQVLWVNLHGAFLLAPALLGVVGLCALVCARAPALARGEAYEERDGLQPLAVAGLLLLAGLLNPRGAQLYAFSFEMLGANDYIKAAINEWYPALSAAHRGTWDYWVFASLLLGTGATFAIRPRALSLVDVALVVVTMGLALSAFRFVPYAALVAAPALARAWRPRDARAAWADVLAGGGLCLFVLLSGPGTRIGSSPGFGAGLPPRPVDTAVTALERAGVEGAVFHEYEDGAYLLYRAPALRPVIDGRIDLYGEDLYGAWREARLEPGALAPYADRYEVQAIVLRNPGPNSAEVLGPLLKDPRWREGPLVDGWAILLRATAK